jgi:multisubunit Na+/H+ antiporter MnhG subunit
LLLLLLAPAAEHLVEEAKLRRDGARHGEEEKGDETHRVVVLVFVVVRGGVGSPWLARDVDNEVVV